MTCPRGAKLPAGVDQEQDLAFPSCTCVLPAVPPFLFRKKTLGAPRGDHRGNPSAASCLLLFVPPALSCLGVSLQN